MNKKIKAIASTFTFAAIIFALSISCWLKPDTAFSQSERRELVKKTKPSTDTVLTGVYMESFEEASVDQFPMRDLFRRIKAQFVTSIINKADNNGIFTAEGHISKLEYPANEDMTNYAADKFNYLYNTYMKDKNMNIYLSVIPDKNFILAKKNGYISIDYDKFAKDFSKKVPYMKYIDITPHLNLDDFYRTDSHWRQENITDIAEHLASSMGTDVSATYTTKTLDNPFYGVYAGQSALPTEPDTLNYLTNDMLETCTVTYYDTGIPKVGDMYNMEKAYGKDPYEMFLSGTSALLTIENPNATSEKELILLRDSYANSLAPLLAQGYKKITVVDIRYIQSNFLGNFIQFKDQDVLFLYSTVLLNNSTALR